MPLDVTRRHRFTEADREALLAAGTPLAEDPAAPAGHRVVLSVTGEAAPLIRTLIIDGGLA